MSEYKAEDCYFAIENYPDVGVVAVIAPKEHWDEDGCLDDCFTLDSFEEGHAPDFLSTEITEATFEPIEEDLSFEELKDKMLEAGFEYNLELQAFINGSLVVDEELDEEEEAEYEEDEWSGDDPDYSIN